MHGLTLFPLPAYSAQIFEEDVTSVKNFGIWIRYQVREQHSWRRCPFLLRALQPPTGVCSLSY
jgi:hypothetical protein